MSDQPATFIVRALHRPPPLLFTLVPTSGSQPSMKARCGHTVWYLEDVVVDGRTLRHSNPNFSVWLTRVPQWLRSLFARDSCSLCQHKRVFENAIRCAYCDSVIFPGDPVSIYFPSPVPDEFQGDRVVLTENGFVGCMGRECCPTGGFFAGHWTAEGVLSPFSTGTAAGQAFEGEGMIISEIGSLGQTEIRVLQ